MQLLNTSLKLQTLVHMWWKLELWALGERKSHLAGTLFFTLQFYRSSQSLLVQWELNQSQWRKLWEKKRKCRDVLFLSEVQQVFDSPTLQPPIKKKKGGKKRQICISRSKYKYRQLLGFFLYGPEMVRSLQAFPPQPTGGLARQLSTGLSCSRKNGAESNNSLRIDLFCVV